MCYYLSPIPIPEVVWRLGLKVLHPVPSLELAIPSPLE
jgi:hypothetical protein